MKVIKAQEMARIEKKAIEEGADAKAFMDMAGKGVAEAVLTYCKEQSLQKRVTIIGGKGNNAGDAYVAGMLLLKQGFKVSAFQIAPFNKCSSLCTLHGEQFIKDGGVVFFLKDANELVFPEEGIILDGLLGTGFSGEVKGIILDLIHQINAHSLPVLSIDIPSGLNGSTGEVVPLAIKAALTIYLGLPKTGFFINSGWNYVGKLHHVSFGLASQYIDRAKGDFFILTKAMMTSDLPPISNSRHKYESGYVVGLAGSKGMSGAAILSGSAALKTGAGIVRLLHPEGMEAEFAAHTPELIKQPYKKGDEQIILEAMNKASAAYIGPGIGQSKSTKEILHYVLPRITVPCVLDADALNLIALMDLAIPQRTILTPHLGELCRLMHLENKPTKDLSFFQQCQKFCETLQCCLILKGGPSFIFFPNSPILVSVRGDAGMATAGSGDVLTGMIAALLSQKLSLRDAAALGVFLHGLSGEIAAEKRTSYSMIASDILDNISNGFKLLLP